MEHFLLCAVAHSCSRPGTPAALQSPASPHSRSPARRDTAPAPQSVSTRSCHDQNVSSPYLFITGCSFIFYSLKKVTLCIGPITSPGFIFLVGPALSEIILFVYVFNCFLIDTRKPSFWFCCPHAVLAPGLVVSFSAQSAGVPGVTQGPSRTVLRDPPGLPSISITSLISLLHPQGMDALSQQVSAGTTIEVAGFITCRGLCHLSAPQQTPEKKRNHKNS